MVSGFIEEQEMRFNEEGTGESDAHAPSITHVFCEFLHHRLGELEAMRNEAGFSFECCWVHLFKLFRCEVESGFINDVRHR